MFATVYNSAHAGGAAAGALFWQLMTEGMDSYEDGYEVVLRQAPSVHHKSHQEAELEDAGPRLGLPSRARARSSGS